MAGGGGGGGGGICVESAGDDWPDRGEHDIGGRLGGDGVAAEQPVVVSLGAEAAVPGRAGLGQAEHGRAQGAAAASLHGGGMWVVGLARHGDGLRALAGMLLLMLLLLVLLVVLLLLLLLLLLLVSGAA